MYSHIMGMDDELWEILEEGVGDLKLDEEGAALDRKAHTANRRRFIRNITRLEAFWWLPCLIKSS